MEFSALAKPDGLTPALAALWHDARGDWAAAHTAAQGGETHDAAWAHAYLHRKEGDAGNAGYWYARARRAVPAAGVALDTEREAIARELLGQGGN